MAQKFVVANGREIDSLSSNFSGLGFLDTLLEGKRIVMLGESSHGTEEYSSYKFQLIRYLHERLGYNVLLFESPMVPGAFVNFAKDTASATSLMKNGIQSIWHTRTIAGIFDYIRSSGLKFEGFDPQRIMSGFQTSFYAEALNRYPSLRDQFIGIETTTDNRLSTSLSFGEIATKLKEKDLTPIEAWAAQMASVSSSYYHGLNDGEQRDKSMAENIIWISEHLYPNEKIIVWAHNTHIDKESNKRKRIMGRLLNNHFGDKLYGVGLYMVNGTTALNNRQIIAIKPPPKGSLEGLSMRAGMKAVFIPTRNKIFDKRMVTLHWGKDKQKMNLSKSYDAVIVVSGVHPPEYIP